MAEAYVLGIVHAPPGTASYSRLPSGYALNRDELRVLAQRIPGSALTVEHNGIHEAVDRAARKAATESTNHLATRDRVIAELHDLGESDATKSAVGTIVDARLIEPEGGLYVIAAISAGLIGVAHLVRAGFLTGLSLSTVVDSSGLVPVEISLTKEPARPHSYIVFSSGQLEKVQEYLGKIQSHIIRDYSGSIDRPTRVMAASAKEMEVDGATLSKDAAPSTTPTITTEAILKALENHPDPEARTLLMASLDKMGAEALKQKQDRAAAQSKIETLEKDLEASKRTGRLNTAMLESTLSQFRASLPPAVAEEYPADLEKRAMDTTDADVVRAAWNQQLVTASLKTMHEKMAAEGPTPTESNRKRKSDEESTRSVDSHDWMAGINSLISASAERAPPIPGHAPPARDGAGPAVDSGGAVMQPGATGLTVEQQRMAAALKISAALDAF